MSLSDPPGRTETHPCLNEAELAIYTYSEIAKCAGQQLARQNSTCRCIDIAIAFWFEKI